MGTFFQPIKLIGPTGASQTIEALVDTGAVFTAIPGPVLEGLGVRPFDTVPVRFVNGKAEQWPLAQVEAEMDGRRRPILCLPGTADASPLIGAHTLEAFLVIVDPVERRLVPKEAYLMPATSL